MKEPKRLHEEARGFEARLLASAAGDIAPKDLHDDLHAVLLVSATTVAVGSAALAGAGTNAALAHAGAGLAATSNVTTAVAVSGVAGVTSTVGSIAALKWVGFAALAAVVSVGVHAATTSDTPTPRQNLTLESPPPVPLAATIQAPEPPRVVPVPVPTNVAPDPVTVVAKPPVPSVPFVATAVTLPKPTPPQPASTVRVDDMPRELAVLDEARAAVAAANSTRALETLDLHDRDFPDSRLAAEALALRVEAFAVAHDNANVRSLASAFVATYPDHPLVARMRALAKTASTP